MGEEGEEEEAAAARKARVRRPAAPPKLGIRVGRNGGAGSGRRGGRAALGNSSRPRSSPRPGPGKEGRPPRLRETLAAARPGDRLPPRGCRAPRPDPGLARGASGFFRLGASWGPHGHRPLPSADSAAPPTPAPPARAPRASLPTHRPLLDPGRVLAPPRPSRPRERRGSEASREERGRRRQGWGRWSWTMAASGGGPRFGEGGRVGAGMDPSWGGSEADPPEPGPAPQEGPPPPTPGEGRTVEGSSAPKPPRRPATSTSGPAPCDLTTLRGRRGRLGSQSPLVPRPLPFRLG